MGPLGPQREPRRPQYRRITTKFTWKWTQTNNNQETVCIRISCHVIGRVLFVSVSAQWIFASSHAASGGSCLLHDLPRRCARYRDAKNTRRFTCRTESETSLAKSRGISYYRTIIPLLHYVVVWLRSPINVWLLCSALLMYDFKKAFYACLSRAKGTS